MSGNILFHDPLSICLHTKPHQGAAASPHANLHMLTSNFQKVGLPGWVQPSGNLMNIDSTLCLPGNTLVYAPSDDDIGLS